MSSEATYQDDDDALAAEVALGVLEGAERTAAEVRLARDPAFAARVADWEQRLGGLNAAYAPVAPSSRLKTQIESRLFGSTTASRGGWLSRLWGSAPFWRAVSGAALAAIAAMALLIAQPEAPTPGDGALPRMLSASIESETRDVGFSILFDRKTGELRARRSAGAAPVGQDHELWIIAGDAPPVSLGVLGDASTVSVIPEARRADFSATATLAVTLEQSGGSPTGAPQGPLIAAGSPLDL